MRRLLIVLSLLLLIAALPAAADAKVRKGPAGIAFYKPPKPLPGGKHGALIWARKLTGRGGAQGRRRQPARCSTARPAPTGKAVAVSGHARRSRRARRRRAAGRSSPGRTARPASPTSARPRATASTPARQLRLPAAAALAEGRLRGRAHRLRGARHAGRAPVPDRPLGGPLACSTRCARRASSTSGSASAWCIAGHSQGGQAALWAASLAPKYTPDLKVRGTVAFAPVSHLAEQARAARRAASRRAGSAAWWR